MKISVIAKTRSKKTFLRKNGASHFVVAVKEVPEKGKANIAIIKALAEYFGVSRSRITIVSGTSAKTKIFEILD